MSWTHVPGVPACTGGVQMARGVTGVDWANPEGKAMYPCSTWLPATRFCRRSETSCFSDYREPDVLSACRNGGLQCSLSFSAIDTQKVPQQLYELRACTELLPVARSTPRRLLDLHSDCMAYAHKMKSLNPPASAAGQLLSK